MNRKVKKVLALLTAAGMCAGACLPYVGTIPVLAAEVNLDDGLRGYWDFDSGNLTNEAGSGYTAELVGNGVTLKDDGGISGGSAYLSQNGSSHIKLKDIMNAAEDFTLSVWVKYDSDAFDNINQNMNLFQQDGSGKTVLFLRNSMTYGTYLTGSDSLCAENTTLGEWNHVVLTNKSNTKQVQFYLNGQLINTNTLSGDYYNGVTSLLVGSHKSASSGAAVKGYVDELRFYTKVLDQPAVTALYDQYGGSVEVRKLRRMVEEAKQLGDKGSDKEALAEVKRQIAAAEDLVGTEDTDIARVRSIMAALKAAVESYQRSISIGISIDVNKELREISSAMFGINHRYSNDGYSSWNTQEKKIEEEFNNYAKEASFGSVRYPGGTVSNLFDWKKSIGPVESRKKTVHGLPDSNAPITPNFGLDEAMTWIHDDMGAEGVYVYGMGQGSAADAADLIEYLNAPNDGSNVNGGIDWAEVRADNGHEEPYHVTRFEMGNEIGYAYQTYWMDGRASGRSSTDAYIKGGTMTFGSTAKVVKEEDWRTSAAASDGTADQVRYVKYDPVTPDTAEVYVAGTKWNVINSETDSLENYGTENVCEIKYDTGRITFGDGKHGNIPASGSVITAAYTTEQDGFVDYYKKMKQTAEQIGIDIQIYSCIYWEEFMKTMSDNQWNDYYDGVVIHPYSDNGIDGADSKFYEKVLARSQSYVVPRVQTLVNQIQKYAPDQGKVPVISEFGIYNYNTPPIRAVTHAVYIANVMMDFINLGTPYINKHCLVDYPFEGDSLGPGSQAVIQAIHDNGQLRFVSTPSAKMFSIFNHMTGTAQVQETVTDNRVFYSEGNTEVDLVHAMASTDEEGNIYLTVVNNSREDRADIDISVPGYDLTGANAQVWYLSGDSIEAENTLQNPDNVDIIKSESKLDADTMKYQLEPHSVTAFKIKVPEKVAVQVRAEEGGKVTGDQSAVKGEAVTVEAVPDEGYTFKGWYQGTEKLSDQPKYTFTAEADMELTARFEKKSGTGTGENPGTDQPKDPVTIGNTSLVSVKATYNSAVLKWKQVSGADGYLIKRAKGSSKVFESIKTIPSGKICSFKNTKLKTGVVYRYQVFAYIVQNGTTVYSKTPAERRVQPLPGKMAIQVKKAGKSRKLIWKKAAGAEGYVIYRSARAKKGFKSINIVNKAKTKQFIDKKAKINKAYYYKIRAYCKVNGTKVYGAYSGVKKAKAIK